MFDFFNSEKDLDSLEIELKLDRDLLEQMLYEFKDEDFYLEPNSAFEMAEVDVTDGELLYIDDFYFVLDHAEVTADMFLYNEYRPSKKVINLIKSLRKASLSAQLALFTLFKKKKRIKKLTENIDSEVFMTIAEFKMSVCNILHEIFETYDINVYPTFRRKTKESVVFYQKQFGQQG
jgi:hypothetical protein